MLLFSGNNYFSVHALRNENIYYSLFLILSRFIKQVKYPSKNSQMHHTNLTYTRRAYITSLINQFGVKEAALIADGTVEVIKK